MPNTTEQLEKLLALRATIKAERAEARKHKRKPAPIAISGTFIGATPLVAQDGVGTELQKIFESLAKGDEALTAKMNRLNFDGSQGCGGCYTLMMEMNQLGPRAVRSRAAEFAKKINANRRELEISWPEIIKKCWRQVLREGLPWTLEGLIEEACRRWERKQAAKEKSPPS